MKGHERTPWGSVQSDRILFPACHVDQEALQKAALEPTQGFLFVFFFFLLNLFAPFHGKGFECCAYFLLAFLFLKKIEGGVFVLRPVAAMVLSTVFYAGDYRLFAEGGKGEIPAKCMQGQNFLECKRLHEREDGFL